MASESVSGAYNVDLNVSKLLDSTSVLASGVTKLNNNANSINTISNSIKSNWTNEYSANSDISTSLEKIQECFIFPLGRGDFSDHRERLGLSAFAGASVEDDSVGDCGDFVRDLRVQLLGRAVSGREEVPARGQSGSRAEEYDAHDLSGDDLCESARGARTDFLRALAQRLEHVAASHVRPQTSPA